MKLYYKISTNFFRFLNCSIFFSGIYLFFDKNLSYTESIIIPLITMLTAILLFVVSFKFKNNSIEKNNIESEITINKNIKIYFFTFMFMLFIFTTSLLLFLGIEINAVTGTNSFHYLDGYERLITLIPMSIFSFLSMICLELFLKNIIDKYNKI